MLRKTLTIIVFTVENLLSPCELWKTYYHHVNCGILTDIVAFNALWKTYYHRVNNEKLTDIVIFMYLRKLTITECTVKNLLSSCVPWKTYLHHTFRKHDIDIVCTVENLLTSSCFMYREKLTDNIVFHVPWKTYSHHRLSYAV